jgi:hypothetical protein
MKRVAISHKHNVIIGGYVPQRPKNDKKKNRNQQFYCLKQNIQPTETDYSML